MARKEGLGDVLMALPGLREVKRLNPKCIITFHSSYSNLIKGIDYIDNACDYDSKKLPANTVRLVIEYSMPSRRHIAELMADHLGVTIDSIKPDCVVDRKLVCGFRQQWAEFPRPWIVANRKSSGHSPNKDWFDDRWDALIVSLAGKATVIEIGNQLEAPETCATGSVIDLRGKTTLLELVAVIAAADLLISPGSGPTHIAAAVGTPAVVILGGYEKPNSAGYPGNIYLTADLACSPCFLNTACPYDKECLKSIIPERVEGAIYQLWNQQFAKNIIN